jgi:hypothetical protein
MRLLFTCRTSFPPGETGSSSGFLEQNLGNGSEQVGVFGFLHRVSESSYVPERGQKSEYSAKQLKALGQQALKVYHPPCSDN